MPVTVTNLGEVIVAGNDYEITLTLTKNGATYPITGATITCSLTSIRNTNHPGISDHAVTITDGPNGGALLTITSAESLAMLVVNSSPDPTEAHIFHGDVKVVESGGAQLNCGPFKLEVRYPIT